MQHDSRVVVITGAAGVLGRAVSEAFAEKGAFCVEWDLNIHASESDRDNGRMRHSVDLLDEAAVSAATKRVIDAKGRIDVLCNIAGGFASGPMVHEGGSLLDRLFDLNVRTMVNAVQAVVPTMISSGAGKIVNVGASRATAGAARSGAYVASKSAVIRLTESMALELRTSGINVNCVLPSIIDTPDNQASMPNADRGKWVTPTALADVIVFLASDGARAINGAALPVVGFSN